MAILSVKKMEMETVSRLLAHELSLMLKEHQASAAVMSKQRHNIL